MKYQSIVFSGLPGAGKSTLVEKLRKIYGWPVLAVGDLWWANTITATVAIITWS